MDPKIQAYISAQGTDRQGLLSAIHTLILERDQEVIAVVEPMMGKEMIIYKSNGMMKYALSSVKKHISLHVLPMYGSPALHDTYKSLLSKAHFQKGCINFTTAEEIPLNIVGQLFSDCAKIDLAAIRQQQLTDRKTEKGRVKSS
jgi:hypothetical protein